MDPLADADSGVDSGVAIDEAATRRAHQRSLVATLLVLTVWLVCFVMVFWPPASLTGAAWFVNLEAQIALVYTLTTVWSVRGIWTLRRQHQALSAGPWRSGEFSSTSIGALHYRRTVLRVVEAQGAHVVSKSRLSLFLIPLWRPRSSHGVLKVVGDCDRFCIVRLEGSTSLLHVFAPRLALTRRTWSRLFE